MQAEGEETASEYLRVYSFNLDAEQGKVTVAGNVDPNTLIKRLQKKDKHTQLKGWESSAQHSSSRPRKLTMEKVPNVGNLNKGGKDQKGQEQQQQHQQLLQKIKGLKDTKLPQFKDLKLPTKAQKFVKFMMTWI